MSFKTKKYLVIKNAIPKDVANFVYNYFLIKKTVAKTLQENKFLPPFDTTFGTFNDPQVPNSYAHYADIAMETLLLMVKPLMEQKTKTKLVETYSYARIYYSGNKLRRHKDRPSCEISCTMNLGGDEWPIFIDPTGTDNVIDEDKEIHKPNAPKGNKVNLAPGDLLIYRGCELEHWREPFEGDHCVQVFLHYNDSKNQENIFDGRPHVGLPKGI
jgi:hypothetical protein